MAVRQPGGGTEQVRKAALKELSAEWDRRLASLQAPETAARVDAAFAAKGKVRNRSKAGESF